MSEVGGPKRALLAMLFQVEYGRNAWHSTWVWDNWSEPCLSLSDATDVAERGRAALRERGTHWSISELPACAVTDGQQVVVIAEPRSRAPLSAFRFPDWAAQSLPELFAALRRGETDRRYWSALVTLSRVVEKGTSEYGRWHSSSVGGDQLLDWDWKADRKPVILDGVEALCGAINLGGSA